MPRAPRFSVLMAAYNAERYVAEAIESVLSQTFQDWELVIVDDGSTDRTGEIAESYAAKDPRVRLYRSPANTGLGAARQRTLELARGRHAAVLDADDVVLPDWLAVRARLLTTHGDLAFVSGSRLLIDGHGRRIGRTHEGAPPEVLRWRLLFGNPVRSSSSRPGTHSGCHGPRCGGDSQCRP